jgi:uncharacterized protein YecT (DUF1311 family)
MQYDAMTSCGHGHQLGWGSRRLLHNVMNLIRATLSVAVLTAHVPTFAKPLPGQAEMDTCAAFILNEPRILGAFSRTSAIETNRCYAQNSASFRPYLSPIRDACWEGREYGVKWIDSGQGKRQLECLKYEVIYHEGRLTQAYIVIMRSIAPEKSETLRERQRQWIIDKDLACIYISADYEGDLRRDTEQAICNIRWLIHRRLQLEPDMRD